MEWNEKYKIQVDALKRKNLKKNQKKTTQNKEIIGDFQTEHHYLYNI